MTLDVADRITENALRLFSTIDTVQFIGGEPSLNLPAIAQICSGFSRAVDAGRLARLPRLVITTNGTQVTDRFVDLARSFGLLVTISLDGPSQVHDQVRQGTKGQGTYQLVRSSIQRLLDAEVCVDFEATFSRVHLQHGLHLIDLCQWFRDEFGLHVLHAPPVSPGQYASDTLVLTREEKLCEYCRAAEWGVDNLIVRHDWMADSFTARILEALAAKSRSQSICSAGQDLVCIAADGTAYPCWMLMGEPLLKLGSFLDPSLEPWNWALAQQLLGPGDLESPECQPCWVRPLCFGCRGASFRATGDLHQKYDCDFTRGIVATVMMRLCQQAVHERPVADLAPRPAYGERMYLAAAAASA